MNQNDEMANEKIFMRAKIERLEKKIYDLIDSSELTKKQETEQERIKTDILSNIIRT